MKTKLLKKNQTATVLVQAPWIQPLWVNNKKLVKFSDGTIMPFEKTSGKVQRALANLCLNNKVYMAHLKAIGVKGFSAEFNHFYKNLSHSSILLYS